MPTVEELHPAYKQGQTAITRLTDARAEVYSLLTLLPPENRSDLIRLYNRLCRVQGALENLLKEIPVVVHREDE